MLKGCHNRHVRAILFSLLVLTGIVCILLDGRHADGDVHLYNFRRFIQSHDTELPVEPTSSELDRDPVNDSSNGFIHDKDHMATSGGDTHNSTLGVCSPNADAKIEIADSGQFQKIFVLSMPSRTDKRDALTISAYFSGLDIEFVDGVNGSLVSPKAYPVVSRFVLIQAVLADYQARIGMNLSPWAVWAAGVGTWIFFKGSP